MKSIYFLECNEDFRVGSLSAICYNIEELKTLTSENIITDPYFIELHKLIHLKNGYKNYTIEEIEIILDNYPLIKKDILKTIEDILKSKTHLNQFRISSIGDILKNSYPEIVSKGFVLIETLEIDTEKHGVISYIQ